MCEFRVGETVKCISRPPLPPLVCGEHYKLVGVYRDSDYVCVRINQKTLNFHKFNFEKVDEMIDLTKIDSPFGELPKEVQLSLFSAWLDGKTIQCYCDIWEKNVSDVNNKWIDLCRNKPSWFPEIKYRLKPKTLVPDYINWDHVDKNYNAMARSSHNHPYLFRKIPVTSYVGYWYIPGSNDYVASAQTFSSYKQGTVDWKDSLVIRPGYSE